MSLVYNHDNNSWNVTQNGETRELFRINENGSVEYALPNGEAMIVMPDAQGIASLRAATSFAMR